MKVMPKVRFYTYSKLFIILVFFILVYNYDHYSLVANSQKKILNENYRDTKKGCRVTVVLNYFFVR